jgi:hypothetical protein
VRKIERRTEQPVTCTMSRGDEDGFKTSNKRILIQIKALAPQAGIIYL